MWASTNGGIIIEDEEWKRIYEEATWVERQKKENKEKEETKLRRKEESDKMSRSWQSRIMDRKSRTTERRRKLEEERHTKEKKFLQMKKLEEKVKKEIRSSAIRLLYQERDEAKTMMSAIRFSEIIRARNEQLNFIQKIKQDERSRMWEEMARMNEEAHKHKVELQEEVIKAQERKMMIKKEMTEWLNAYLKRKEEEKEKELEEGKEYLRQVIDKINEANSAETKAKLAKKQAELRKSLADLARRSEEKERAHIEDIEDNLANLIIMESKRRIEGMTKKKEFQHLKDMRAKRERLMKAADVELHQKLEAEKNIEDRKAAEEASKKCLELATREKVKAGILRQAKFEAKKQMEEKVRNEKERDAAAKHRAVLDRYEQEQITKEFEEKVKIADASQKKHFKEIWLQQMMTETRKKKQQKKEDFDAIHKSMQSWEEADRHFSAFVDEVKKECKEKGRPLYPIEVCYFEWQKRSNLNQRTQANPMFISKLSLPPHVNGIPFYASDSIKRLK